MNDLSEKVKAGMSQALKGGFLLIYFAIGVLCLAAIYSGARHTLNFPWYIAGPGSIFLAYIPVVGSAIGVWGAMNAWGWGFWPAFKFFFWHIGVMLLLMILYGVASIYESLKR